MPTTVKAKVKWVEGMKFSGESADGRTLVLNSAEEMGQAFTPMELFLISQAGCTAMDTVWILEKERQKVESLVISVQGIRRDEDPRYYETIDLEFLVSGKAIRKESVERAIRLSQEKYCSARAMLRPDIKVRIVYRIATADEPEQKYEYAVPAV